MTRQQIRDMARKRLGETSGVFWSDPEINHWINKAGQEIAFKTKCLKTNGFLSTTQDISEYSLSTNFPKLYSVLDVYFYQSGTIWLKMTAIPNREDLDLRFPGWKNTPSSVPFMYYYDREENNLMFYPAPNSANSGTNYVQVYYSMTFTELATDSSQDAVEPALPNQLHTTMVDWVVALGYETRGYGDKANDAMAKFEKGIHTYLTVTRSEKEDDEIVMRSYRRRAR